jgi:hypothetical protein
MAIASSTGQQHNFLKLIHNLVPVYVKNSAVTHKLGVEDSSLFLPPQE